MEMEGSRNSISLSTSDVGVVVNRYNLIRIWGAEVKAALGLILAEPSIVDDEIAPFVPEVGHGAPSGAWHLLRASDRITRQAMGHYWDGPWLHLLQEVTGTMFRG